MNIKDEVLQPSMPSLGNIPDDKSDQSGTLSQRSDFGMDSMFNDAAGPKKEAEDNKPTADWFSFDS